MRCPYCGSLNSEQASFCAQCGRDLPHAQTNTRQQPAQQPYQPPRQQLPQSQRPPYQPTQHPFPTQGATRPAPPAYQPQQVPVAVPPRQAPVQQPMRTPFPGTPPPQQQVVETPANFPPHTMAHLKALQDEAVPYTLLGEAVVDGRKKMIRIAYRRCAPWQQIATLLKAFNEQPAQAFATVIVQGSVERETTPYEFSNGQLRFDRNVRLGSQTMNRYQIETGNGFESDSIRIVLSE